MHDGCTEAISRLWIHAEVSPHGWPCDWDSRQRQEMVGLRHAEAGCLTSPWGVCTCPMSIEDSAGADARQQMLAHTMRDVSGGLGATRLAFGMIVTHPNEWVHGCVQKAWSGHRNAVISGKPGLGDKPAVQAGQRLVSLGPRDVSKGPDMPLGSWDAGNASQVEDQG